MKDRFSSYLSWTVTVEVLLCITRVYATEAVNQQQSPATASTLNTGANTLDTGANTLDTGANTLDTGANTPATAAGTFLYFSYGSNLLAERIHLNNPSAQRRGPGLLKEYRLDFHGFSKRWGGAVATVVPDKDEHVWGAIWEIDNKDMAALDSQEGVALQTYKVFHPSVLTPSNETLICRSYMLVQQPPKVAHLPPARYPSHIYHKVIVEGAKQSDIPEEYVSKLLSFPCQAKVEGASIPDGVPTKLLS